MSSAIPAIRSFWVWIASTIACAILYFPGLSGHFMFDDIHTVENNEWIQITSLDYVSLKLAAESFAGGGRELAMLSFAINHFFFGQSEFAYKAVNLAIHCSVGLLLLVLSRIIFNRLVPARERDHNAVLRWGPEIVTGLWMLSPINLTSVLYISQRMASMSALFVVAGLLVYVLWRSRIADGKGHWWPAYPFFIACLAGAYFSKQNGILLVPFVLAVEICVFQSRTSFGRVNWRLVLALCLFVVAAVIFAMKLEGTSLSRLVGGYSHRPFTLEERVLTQGRVLIFYIGLVLFPIASRMGLWHDYFVKSTSLFHPIDTFTSIGLLVLLFVLAFTVVRKYPICSLGILWFFVGHALESTIIPLEMVHEHRNYLPAFGILLTVVGMLGYLTRARVSYKLLLIGVLGVAASFNLHARASGWANEYRHALYEFENHPTSPRATFEAAITSAVLAYRGVEGAQEAAFTLLQHARDIGDASILPETAMLLISSLRNDGYETEWIDSAARKLSASGGTVSDSVALRGLRQCMENNECEIGVGDIRPLYDAAAGTSYPLAVYEAARFFHDIGEHERSMAVLKRAADFGSRRIEIKLNYIAALINDGRYEEAREYLERLENQPTPIYTRYLPIVEKARRRLDTEKSAATQ